MNDGPISRAAIAKSTGLSKQTVSEIVGGLEDAGWVRETGRTSGHVGRSAVNYEIVPEAAYIAAVDLGGTKVRAVIADLACSIHGERVEPTDPKGGVAVAEQIARLCRQVAEDESIPLDKLALAVVGAPGVPEPETGSIQMSPNIGGIDTIDFAGAIRDALGVDVVLENDVNLAVLGENWLGLGQGASNLAFIALGTGIGGGLILNGELIRGAANSAGELGFLPFGADPFEPESNKAGALERVVATVGMKNRYRELSGDAVEVPEIFDRAEQGDQNALTVLDETAKYLARAVCAVCAVANPEKVILGGSIGERSELVDRVRTLLPAGFSRPITVERSALGHSASLIGAAAIGLTQLRNALFGAEAPAGTIALPSGRTVNLSEAAQ